MDQQVYGVSWADRTLADLSKAAGTPRPAPLRAFGRRILEFPTHYHDLHAMARASHLSRGALKARFRRRGLESPYTYLRWFRMMAVSYLLSDREVTVAQAAYRLGFTSDGNLCRAMVSLTRLTPTEVRTVRGWNRLLIAFAWTYLTGFVARGVEWVARTLRPARRLNKTSGAEGSSMPLARVPTLAPTLATNRRFAFPLALGTRLLVVPALAQLGI